MRTATTDSPRRDLVRPLALAALAGGAAATALAVAVHALARAAGDPLVVTVAGRGSQQVALGAVVAVTMGAAVAAGLAALAAAFTPRPRAVFLTAATLGLAVSLLPPATAAGGATTWWLEAMHVAVFAGLAPALARALPTANTPRIGLAVAPGPS